MSQQGSGSRVWLQLRETGEYCYWSAADQCYIFYPSNRRASREQIPTNALRVANAPSSAVSAAETPRNIPSAASAASSWNNYQYSTASTSYGGTSSAYPPQSRGYGPGQGPQPQQSQPGMNAPATSTRKPSISTSSYGPVAQSSYGGGQQSTQQVGQGYAASYGTSPNTAAAEPSYSSYYSRASTNNNQAPGQQYTPVTQQTLARSGQNPSNLTSAFSGLNISNAPQQSFASQMRLAGTDPLGTHYDLSFGPPDDITDPDLRKEYHVVARKKVSGTPGETEYLDQTYKVKKQPRKFFVFGKVFLVLWAEPAGAASDANTEITRDTRFGESIYSKVRRFVVVREAENYCSAIPILTHNGKGAAKHGVKKADFAVIYTGKDEPQIRPDERPAANEHPMRPNSIRVDPDERGARLSDFSRLNFGKVYTIEHNVKVKSFGVVNRDSRGHLFYQFRDVWMSNFMANMPGNVLPSPTQAGGFAGSISTQQTIDSSQYSSAREAVTREQLAFKYQQPVAGPASVRSQPRSAKSAKSRSVTNSRRKSSRKDDETDESSGDNTNL